MDLTTPSRGINMKADTNGPRTEPIVLNIKTVPTFLLIFLVSGEYIRQARGKLNPETIEGGITISNEAIAGTMINLISGISINLPIGNINNSGSLIRIYMPSSANKPIRISALINTLMLLLILPPRCLYIQLPTKSPKMTKEVIKAKV